MISKDKYVTYLELQISSIKISMGSFNIFIILFFLCLIRISSCTTTFTDHCLTSSCNHVEFMDIHFPFRLPQFNKDPSCSYDQNFTLSCSPLNQTLIHLPNSGSFAIKTISYYDQTLEIFDPNNCLAQRIFDGFDLSTSAFTTELNSYYTYTYYNCTSLPFGSYYKPYLVSCMSGANYSVILMPGLQYNVSNCNFVKTVFSAPDLSYEYGYEQARTLIDLYWYEPLCGICLSEDRICGFKSHSKSVVGCYPTKGPGLSDGAKYGIILGISIPSFLIIVISIHNCARKSQNALVQQPHAETQLMQHQTTGTVRLGLDGPTIESYPKFKLGQNDVLLEPNTGPCSICLCEYKPSDTLRTIPDCNHYFHSDCVDEWLKLNATCPVCRKVPDAT